jgi:hypothetical protein
VTLIGCRRHQLVAVKRTAIVAVAVMLLVSGGVAGADVSHVDPQDKSPRVVDISVVHAHHARREVFHVWFYGPVYREITFPVVTILFDRDRNGVAEWNVSCGWEEQKDGSRSKLECLWGIVGAGTKVPCRFLGRISDRQAYGLEVKLPMGHYRSSWRQSKWKVKADAYDGLSTSDFAPNNGWYSGL